ncbi:MULTISPECIES: hypothetical protein [Deinococcus]|uniref:Uncharacterized protein n=1 Tax=Deinococcus rufus TaxID=2136097 RepID=A0ABV7ZBK5_9DEIO|nr:hypothetical protein [Deinococcus sp. AB2017081]WQE94059.1 hypothetical protein U2P90_11630 [Deinococcus sp. AB2017081]
MTKRYTFFHNESDSKEARRRRVNPADVTALEQRAAQLTHLPGHGRALIVAQARAAYALRLDFLRHGLPGDFTAWLSRHSGMAYTTCYRRWKAGRALAMGSKPTRNQSGLLQEQRERETTPVAEIDWDDD